MTGRGFVRRTTGRLSQLSIGDTLVKDLLIGRSNGEDSTLSIGFLSKFNVLLSLSTNRLLLKKSSRFESVTYPDGSGIKLILVNGRIVVHFVDPSSPADKHDVKQGDALLVVDGKPAESMSLPQIRRRLWTNQSVVQLELVRNEARYAVTLQLDGKTGK